MILLKKDLKFYEKKWDSDQRKYVEHILNEHQILSRLTEWLEIEDKFTLRHYFEALKKYEFFKLFDNFIPFYIEEYEKTCCGENHIMNTTLDFISVQKITSIKLNIPSDQKTYKLFLELKGKFSKYQPTYEVEESFHISGFGYDEDSKEFTDWGIEFSPIKDLIDLEIRIEPHIVYKDSDNLFNSDLPPEEKQRTEYISKHSHVTTLDFFKEIIWEMSFFGVPEDRDEKKKELFDAYDECKKELE